MNPQSIQLQVVQLFEKYPDMTVEEIAQDQNLTVDFVRATLMTKSEVYRSVNKAKEAKREFISEEELHDFYADYKALAKYSESDVVKEKCLSKLIDDGRGRLEPSKKSDDVARPQENIINIITIMLERAKSNKEIAVKPALELEETVA